MKRYLPLLFVLYMSLIGGNYLAYNLILPLRIAHHLVMTALLIYWFGSYGLPSTPMLIPAAGMVAALGLSTAAAMDARMALENTWHWIINLGLFLMMIDWFRKGYGNLLFGGAFASGGLVAGSSVLQGVLMPGERVAGLLGIVNLTGGYTAAQMVPALGWTSLLRSKKAKLLLFGLVAGQLLTLYLNQSRGALLSFGVAFMALTIPVIARKLHMGIVAIPIVMFVLAGIGVWSAQPGHSQGDVLRMDLWRAASQMIDARPVSGVGVGLFSQLYRNMTNLYRLDSDGVTGAHNLYLNIGAEMGAAGLLAGAGMILTAGYCLTKTDWNLAKLAILAGLLGILAHMVVDNFPAQNFTFLVSLYTAYLIHEQRLGKPHKALGRAVVLGVLLFGLVMLHFDRAQYWYERSLSGDLVAALHARELDPAMKLYQLNVVRLEKGINVIWQLDPTIRPHKTKLGMYALVQYGRYW